MSHWEAVNGTAAGDYFAEAHEARPGPDQLAHWDELRAERDQRARRGRLDLLDRELQHRLDQRAFRVWVMRQARRSVPDVAAALRIGDKTVQRE